MQFSISYIISQILVILYYLIYSSTFHLKENKKILIFGIVATVLSSMSYFLLSAYTGMAMCFIAIIRNILFYKNKKNIKYFIIIIIITLFFSIFTYSGWFCLFNILATLIYTYALWQENNKKYKLLGILVNGLMIIYNIYIQSIMGVILISVSFISSIVGYIRTYSDKGDKNNERTRI